MSNENKEAYEVGIPLDDLPSPQEDPADQSDQEIVAPETDTDVSPTEVVVDSPEDPAGLPDLFDPEELAEVGLTAELAPPEDREENQSPVPPAPIAADENNSLAVIDSEDENAEGRDNFIPDTSETEIGDGDSDPESPLALEPLSDDVPPDEVAVVEPPLSTNDEVLIEDDVAGKSGDRRDEVGLATSLADGAFIDQDLLAGRLESLGLQIEELQREFAGKLKYDAHKDEIIDRLHSELQEYKQDIIKKYVLSIVMDVVKVADDIRKWLAYFRSLEVSQRDPRKLFRYVEAIPSDLEDVFYWHGVKPFSHQDGAFDPSRQRAIKKIPTDDPALDKCVAHSIRPGYEWETKVIRQEMVAVYVFKHEQESLDTGMIDE
ncbi:MAG: nucleotide exchange factor GrpE [Desulfobacterales bacterium]|nr:nucleotide exchange factor GrpE [Desulfobacterales bacterium]